MKKSAGPKKKRTSAADPNSSYPESLTNRMLGRSIRLAVTGLSRSGKTVFITSLIHQLLDGKKLPFLGVVSAERYLGTKLVIKIDDIRPEFRYRNFISKLISETPSWPESTDRISTIRLNLSYRPSGILQQKITDFANLYLDIVDYPGEWLLDLPMLNLSYEDWSKKTLDLCKQEPRATLANKWLQFIASVEHNQPADDNCLRQAAELYTEFLKKCKNKKEENLHFLQPGNFATLGELEQDYLQQAQELYNAILKNMRKRIKKKIRKKISEVI